MSAMHFTLMGKGGVGKSFITTLIAQYLAKQEGANLFCADTDPTNPTFSSYPAFKAKHVNIMTSDMNVDKGNFDGLMDELIGHEGDCVVDNGASSFLPMMAYIRENKVMDYLLDHGKTVYIHAPLIGGIGMDETIRGLHSILEHQPADLIVWENEMFGPVTKNDKYFIESQFYKTHAKRIKGIVRIDHRSEDTYGKTLRFMTSNRMTFQEASKRSELHTFDRQRLITVEKAIGDQLDLILKLATTGIQVNTPKADLAKA